MHGESRRQEREEGKEGRGSPIETASLSNTPLQGISAPGGGGHLGRSVFHPWVLDLASTLLNFGSQSGVVAFGGRETSSYGDSYRVIARQSSCMSGGHGHAGLLQDFMTSARKGCFLEWAPSRHF